MVLPTGLLTDVHWHQNYPFSHRHSSLLKRILICMTTRILGITEWLASDNNFRPHGLSGAGDEPVVVVHICVGSLAPGLWRRGSQQGGIEASAVVPTETLPVLCTGPEKRRAVVEKLYEVMRNGDNVWNRRHLHSRLRWLCQKSSGTVAA